MKKLFLFCFFIIIGAGVWGYNNGMRPDNYKEFISSFMSNTQQKEAPQVIETKSKKIVSLVSEKKKTRKKAKYELLPLPENPFLSIDGYSKKCPSSATENVQRLAEFLQQYAKTDLEKARAIFIWIAHNIRYDDDAYNTGVYPDYTPEYVLKNRKAVCEGYSDLYVALGIEMGLDIEKVVGYSKGYGYSVGDKLTKSNHAWNTILIDGKWKIFDSTWGSGNGSNVNGQLVSKMDFDEYWFDVDPYESIFNHFPEDKGFSFIQPSLSLSQYGQLPNIDRGYFELGFNGRETYMTANANPLSQFPKCYRLRTPIELIAAPSYKNLKKGQSYHLEFYIPRGLKVAVIDSNNDWSYFERENGKFKLAYSPQVSGKLQISVQYEKSSKSFGTFLEYNVEL